MGCVTLLLEVAIDGRVGSPSLLDMIPTGETLAGITAPPTPVVTMERATTMRVKRVNDEQAAGPSASTPPQASPTRTSEKDAPSAERDAPEVLSGEGWSVPSTMLSLSQAKVEDGSLVQTLPSGDRVEYTVSPFMQRAAKSALARYGVEHGALVALNPATGEVLAYAEHAEGRSDLKHLPLQSGGPAASVFKMVTSTALLEKGLSPTETICTHGGWRKLSLHHLTYDKKRDKKCITFAEAFGASNNVAFARWADQHLSPESLKDTASRFYFGRRIPFVFGVGVSEPIIPTGSRLGFARAAAGFSRTGLSVLHGAMIAASVANDGTMMKPLLVRRATREDKVLLEPEPEALSVVMSPETAAELEVLMLDTVESGTARKFFYRGKRPRVPGVRIAGKTGHLSGGGALSGHYSWFVAYAPADNPEIAVAGLVVNGEVWTTKGAVIVQRLLSHYFDHKSKAAN